MPNYHAMRIIIGKLALDIDRAALALSFPQESVNGASGTLQVARVLFTSDRGMTVGEVTQRTGMPRNTVMRRLTYLVKVGLARRSGRTYRMDPVEVALRYNPAQVLRMAVRIKLAATELELEMSKMDE